MNCADVRQRLLMSERPDKPGPEESRHLASCSTCHAWLRRLVRLERKITELSVPTCLPPGKLLEQITQPATAPLVRVPLQPSAKLRSVREVGRQKLALAFSLAATLTLFTFAWWAWPPRSDVPTVSWRPRIEQRKLAATTPQARVEALAGLVDELLADAQARGDKPRDVEQVADDFETLTGDLFIAAQAMSPAERAQLLPEIANRLGRTESSAGHMAAEWKSRRPEAARAMDQIARSARETEQKIRRLAGA